MPSRKFAMISRASSLRLFFFMGKTPLCAIEMVILCCDMRSAVLQELWEEIGLHTNCQVSTCLMI
jgi:hypothetical protein